MAIFSAVNRCIRISLEMGCRSSPVFSWVLRAYNSSGPVRYVPGNYTHNKKAKKLSTPPQSSETKGAVSPKNKVSNGERVFHKSSSSAYGDVPLHEISLPELIPESECTDVFSYHGDFSECENATVPESYCTDGILLEESELFIDEPQNLYGDKISERDQLHASKIKQDAEKMAIESLATRAFTAVELRKKLCGKKYPRDIIESVMLDLKGRGLLNDGLYAESYSQSRWVSSCWGPRRIKRALLQKGVSEADVDKATKQVFVGGDTSSSSQDARLGMSKLSMDRLFALASKQWLRAQNTSAINRKSRMVRWLQYRGFDWGVTNLILRKLESEYPS